MLETRTVGKSVPRLDGRETVSGAALYTADFILPSCLHAKLFRSSVAHGKIRRLDVTRAKNLKGVGEVSLFGIAPAIANAVANATGVE